MATMAGHFDSLDQYGDLENEIIKTTKINKVLKAILKLNSIPKEEEFGFKKRSTDLLAKWAQSPAGGDSGGAPAAEASTNGVTNGDKAKTPEVSSAVPQSNGEEKDADVTMTDVKEDAPADAPTEAGAIETAVEASG